MQLVHLRNTQGNDDNIVVEHETLIAIEGKNFQSFSIFNEERECEKASVNQYRMFDRFVRQIVIVVPDDTMSSRCALVSLTISEKQNKLFFNLYSV